MEWLSIIIGFITGGGAIGLAGFFTIKSTIRKANVEAAKLADERYIAQIDHQQASLDKMVLQVDSLTGRLSTCNATIDKHIDRNRELSDRLYHSEQSLNKLNEELSAAKDTIAALIREKGALERINDFLRRWHCARPYAECRRRKPEQKVKEPYEPPVELIGLAAAHETITNELLDTMSVPDKDNDNETKTDNTD